MEVNLCLVLEKMLNAEINEITNYSTELALGRKSSSRLIEMEVGSVGVD